MAVAIVRAGDSGNMGGWASPKMKGGSLEGGGREGNRLPRPLVLHGLSAFLSNGTIEPMVWFDRAKMLLKNAGTQGFEFSQAQGIAAVMDRAEVGSVISTWYGTVDDRTLVDGKLFETAFKKRFGTSKTVEGAG